jgi:hypothetical protein
MRTGWLFHWRPWTIALAMAAVACAPGFASAQGNGGQNGRDRAEMNAARNDDDPQDKNAEAKDSKESKDSQGDQGSTQGQGSGNRQQDRDQQDRNRQQDRAQQDRNQQQDRAQQDRNQQQDRAQQDRNQQQDRAQQDRNQGQRGTGGPAVNRQPATPPQQAPPPGFQRIPENRREGVAERHGGAATQPPEFPGLRGMGSGGSRPTPPTEIGREAARRTIPTASFRGPREREVRAITPERKLQSQRHLNDWVRMNNATTTLPKAPTQDVIGNRIQRDMTFLHPERLAQLNPKNERVRRHCGDAKNVFAFLPRTILFIGFFDESDGVFALRRYPHHPTVVINFYYPYYFSDPGWFAFYYPGYYPSVYSLWGWCPGWVYPERVYYDPFAYVYMTPASARPQTDRVGAERAIDDIRDAWIDSDIELLANHLSDDLDVRVYFDGNYSYTTSTDDFYGLTADTMSTTETVAMDFDQPTWVSRTEVFFTGSQIFRDPDGNRHTLYVSYRLRQLGYDWYIVGFGSSQQPIENRYRDFRY